MRILSTPMIAVLLAGFLISSVTSALAVDATEKVEAHKKLAFDAAKTAVLIMDQNDIVGMLPRRNNRLYWKRPVLSLRRHANPACVLFMSLFGFAVTTQRSARGTSYLPALRNLDF